MWNFRWLYLSSNWYFCLEISEEDALLVKYKFYIFLRSPGKHYMCNAQKSDIVWCEILRSYCYFNRPGFQNPTEVLRFLFYIKLQRQLHTDGDCIVYSLFFNIYLIFNCNFHSLYMLLWSTRYGSLHTRTAFPGDSCVKSFGMFIDIVNLYL